MSDPGPQEDYIQDDIGQEDMGQDGEELDFKKLDKEEILGLYEQACEAAEVDPHPSFVQYLWETTEENESIDLVIKGNDKENFENRVTDKTLSVIVEVLEDFAIYVEDIDLRYNLITDMGAEMLSRLISWCERLLGLNVQGNQIAIDGAQSLAEALKKCELL